ncbi:MAG: transglycosylase SLT domain-containing protein [Bacteroidetes bacterium]|nr:transglycosylase SLT domain-containing protein [Bacteroidota bacterium]
MKYTSVIIIFLFFSCSAKPDKKFSSATKKNILRNDTPLCVGNLCYNVVGIYNPSSKLNENFILDKQLYTLKIDTVPQVKFWMEIMQLKEDSALINIGFNRFIIKKIHLNEWQVLSDSSKNLYKDSIRKVYMLDSTYNIYLTNGKKYFYDFNKAYQNFSKGIDCFVENGVDPWYAQAILLIESPNKLQKSNVGAYGPFQLMPNVARLFGLKVNKHIDERANFERSAFAASSLIKKICIPNTLQILDSLGLKSINQNDLWFKLLVMHVYHAGFYNVQQALLTIQPKTADMRIIFKLWQTRAAKFKNSSQNYSQLILAAMLQMNTLVKNNN